MYNRVTLDICVHKDKSYQKMARLTRFRWYRDVCGCWCMARFLGADVTARCVTDRIVIVKDESLCIVYETSKRVGFNFTHDCVWEIVFVN